MIHKKLYLISMILVIFTSLVSQKVLGGQWYPGSLHQHTGYSTLYGYDGNEDTDGDNCGSSTPPIEGHWEGGRTVAALSANAENIGLRFLGFSDHSYCIDSNEFQTVKDHCSIADNDPDFTCLTGEELSTSDVENDGESLFWCDGNLGEAHIGVYGTNIFIAQTPIARHCPTAPTAQGGINEINTQNGISILNHPKPNNGGFLDFESMFDVSGQTGIEIWNDDFDNDDGDSTNSWVTLLLQGNKVYAYGGTDSHEDVSTVNYNNAYIEGALNSSNLKTALENGRVTVSNNGNAYLEAKKPYNNTWTLQGSTLKVCRDDTITVKATYQAVSVPCRLEIIKGDMQNDLEFGYPYDVSGSGAKEIPNMISQDTYFRARCRSDGGESRIYTNPIWVEIDTVDSDGDGVCSTSDCNDADSAMRPNTAETACSDGKDNDCDRLIDGSDPDCGGTGCTCGSWVNAGCGVGDCASSQMRQSCDCKTSFWRKGL